MSLFLPKGRQSGLVVQEVMDEVLVYDQGRYQAHCLNRLAAAVWKECDGRSTPAALAERVAARMGAEVTEDVVWHALYQLSDFHLLEDEPAHVASVAPVTRRQLMMTLTQAGLALPLVLAIAAPAAAQVGSGGTTITGPTGPTGPTGETGETGATGATGAS
jgi:hypothetical protein